MKSSDAANGDGARVVHGDDTKLARPDRREQLDESRHVEHVLQDLAIGLEHHRERRVPARDREEIAGAFALLPERRALSGASSREEQRARRVLAEARREERGGRRSLIRGARAAAADGSDACTKSLTVVRIGEKQIDRRRLVRRREADDDAVVRPEDVRSRHRVRSRTVAPIAIAHGACTRAPKWLRMQTRQSPMSSR